MYNKMLAELMKKKEEQDSPMSDMEKESKISVLNEIRDLASKAMGSKLDGMKKVSVMSDSKEGLEKGLNKAEDLLHTGQDEFASPDEIKEHNAEEMGEPESDEDSDLDHDEIEAKIAKLMELKKKFS